MGEVCCAYPRALKTSLSGRACSTRNTRTRKNEKIKSTKTMTCKRVPSCSKKNSAWNKIPAKKLLDGQTHIAYAATQRRTRPKIKHKKQPKTTEQTRPNHARAQKHWFHLLTAKRPHATVRSTATRTKLCHKAVRFLTDSTPPTTQITDAKKPRCLATAGPVGSALPYLVAGWTGAGLVASRSCTSSPVS